jgi:hypothetical protein
VRPPKKGSVLTFQDTLLKGIAAFALEIKFMVNTLSIEAILYH